MRVRFVYRPGVEDEIAKERTTLDGLDDAAEKIADAARGFAPIRTGRYRSSITTRRDGLESIVVADAPYAKFVEWGTNDTPTMHPLARGAEAVTRSS